MKSKRFVSLSILSILSLGLLTGVITHHVSNASNEVLTTEAWDINVQPSVQESYYSSCDGKTGTALKTTLAGFNKPTSKSYAWARYEAADEAQDDSTSILCLYTRHNIKKNAHVVLCARKYVVTTADIVENRFFRINFHKRNMFVCRRM